MTRLLGIPTVLLLLLPSPAAAGDDISPAGKKLAKELGAMDVKDLWIAKHYVDWETGKIIEPKDPAKHTFGSHCSAFVAAVCVKFNVDMLRPLKANETKEHAPPGLIHSEVFLANAQADWLKKDGKESGWEHVKTALEAQQLANAGKLVVVAFKAKEKSKPGHIAIVRPWKKTEAEIDKEGPEIIQAGATNYEHTSVREGFRHHEGAWPDGVRYYVHPLKK